jgi:hypothetical protein
MKMLKVYLKVKYCAVNIESNCNNCKKQIAGGIYNPRKLQKKKHESSIYAKITLTALVTQSKYGDKYYKLVLHLT